MNNTGTSPTQDIRAALRHDPGVSGGWQNLNQEAVYVNNQVVVSFLESCGLWLTDRSLNSSQMCDQ